jgi:hypothetical protein
MEISVITDRVPLGSALISGIKIEIWMFMMQYLSMVFG